MIYVRLSKPCDINLNTLIKQYQIIEINKKYEVINFDVLSISH